MSDVDANDFYMRIARIQRDHARGHGMEAAGTLGRSFYAARRKTQRRTSYIAPALIVLMCLTGLKAALHARIGDQVYGERVQALMDGKEFERLGGYIMQAGPVTLALSRELRVWGF